MAADLCTDEDREFFAQRVLPLLKLPAHRQLRKHVRYLEARNVGFDEVLLDVRSNHHGATKGWQGLSPRGLRMSNADSPDNILSEMTRIQAGKTPTCAYEYLLSTAEQVRIKVGQRPETVGIVRDGDTVFKAEKKAGANGLIEKEFAQSSTEMAERKRLEEHGSHVFSNLQQHVQEIDRLPLADGLVGLDGKPLKATDEPAA